MKPTQENKRMFEDARDHLNEASLKNSEQLDKAILSLSAAGLALSLSFTKFITPISQAENLWLLHSSWVCFGLAIITTVLSLLTSSSALSIEREHIYKYYMEKNDTYANKSNCWGIITYWLNRFSAAVFILAMISTVSYVWSNSQQEEAIMSQKQSTEKRGYVPPKKQPADSGENSQDQQQKKK